MNIAISTYLQSKISFEVTEDEARALDALAGYGTKEFLECFYKYMGRAYLEPHEQGLKSLFEKIKELSRPLAELHDLRKQTKKIRIV